MTIVRISRTKLINILKNEPFLGSDHWFRGPGDLTLKQMNANCTACAVGSVFRNIVDPSTTIFKAKHVIGELTSVYPVTTIGSPRFFRKMARETLAEGYPMNALSIVFEGYSGNRGVERARTSIIRFVREYFPRSIQIDIDGLTPARDVKVVRRGK